MEVLVLGTLVGIGILALGVLSAVFGLLWWLLTLPFHILGWLLRGLFVLLLLPVFAVLALGFGLAVVLPLAPFLLFGLIVWALVRRRDRPTAAVNR